MSSQPSPDKPSIWLAISIATGLPLLLWAYKCTMLVLFQRKIIYMGYVPPGARTENLHDVPSSLLSGLQCDEIQIASGKNVFLSGIIVRLSCLQNKPPDTVIVYFQGNAGNPLHRIPLFQRLLMRTSMSITSPRSPTDRNIAIVAVAPRSYWKSTPRKPTEKNVLSDYLHCLHDTLNRFPDANVIVYGHSLGGAIALCLLSRLYETEAIPGSVTYRTSFLSASTSGTSSMFTGRPKSRDDNSMDASHFCRLSHHPDFSRIRGLILENPFSSIPSMVRALYPERWVPYRYLAGLAWDKWDAIDAIRRAKRETDAGRHSAGQTVAQGGNTITSSSVLSRILHADDMLVLLSEKDEIVPRSMGEEIWNMRGCDSDSDEGSQPGRRLLRRGKKVIVRNALHDTAWQHPQWLKEVRTYVDAIGEVSWSEM